MTKRITIHGDEIKAIMGASDIYRWQIENWVNEDYEFFALDQIRLLNNLVDRYRKPMKRTKKGYEKIKKEINILANNIKNKNDKI